MLYKATKEYSFDDVCKILHPNVAKWLKSKFSDLTPPQKYAIPLIAQGKNVLVSSLLS